MKESKHLNEKLESILLLVNPEVSECLQSGEHLEKDLNKSGFKVHTNPDAFDSREPDLIIILGGDGYLTECINKLHYPSTCIFGINFGTVGFLMNPRTCLLSLSKTISQRRFQVEEYLVLESRVRFRSGEETQLLAFNDFVLERMSGQSLRFKAFINDVVFNHYSGDGVIIATPGGSTAYNLAAGGPVIHPGIGAMLITPLYPHRATPFHSLQFSLLLPLDRTLIIYGQDVDKRPIRLLADGRPFEDVQNIEVRDSGKRIHLLRDESHSFIETVSRTFIGNDPKS